MRGNTICTQQWSGIVSYTGTLYVPFHIHHPGVYVTNKLQNNERNPV